MVRQMIFTLVSTLALMLVLPARAHVSNATLTLRGAFTKTGSDHVLRHEAGRRVIDLAPFGSRAPAVCDLLLNSTRSSLAQRLDVTSTWTSERGSRVTVTNPNAYGTLTVFTGVDTWRVVADPFRTDEVYTSLAAPTPKLGGELTAYLGRLRAVVARLECARSVAAKPLIAFGKLNDDGDFKAESLSIPMDMIFPTPHYLTVIRGEVLPNHRGLVVVTPHGRRLQLSPSPPVAGTEAVRLLRRFGPTAIGTEATLVGLEVGQELRVFTKE